MFYSFFVKVPVPSLPRARGRSALDGRPRLETGRGAGNAPSIIRFDKNQPGERSPPISSPGPTSSRSPTLVTRCTLSPRSTRNTRASRHPHTRFFPFSLSQPTLPPSRTHADDVVADGTGCPFSYSGSITAFIHACVAVVTIKLGYFS